MEEKISLLRQFGAAQVEDRLLDGILDKYNITGTAPLSEHNIIRTSMRHVYNAVAEEHKFRPYKNLTERSKEIAAVALKRIGYRFALANQYLDDFFPKNYHADYRGLIAAVICDNFIHSLKVHGNAGSSGAKYWEEAQAITENGLDEDVAITPSLEAVFLAHINGFETVAAIQSLELDEFEEDALETLMQKQLMPMHGYIHYGKKIGNALIMDVVAAEAEIQLCLDDKLSHDTEASMPEERSPRPYLRLVHSTPSPEIL